MVGKFYTQKITRIAGASRDVLPVSLHKDAGVFTLSEIRKKLDIELQKHGYRLSKYHTVPFIRLPNNLCFKKTKPNTTAAAYVAGCKFNNLIDIPKEKNNPDFHEQIYFTVSAI